MSTLGKRSRTKSTNVASKLGRKRQQSSSCKVTFCSPKDATAILFVFGTRMVRRYILNIEVDSVAVNSKVVLDIGMVAKGVQSLLTGNHIPNGKIVEIGMIGGVRLLLWKFSETTACSNATASNFHGITAIDRELNTEGSTFQETLSFSFFSLQRETEKKYGFTVYPEDCSEQDRLDALLISLSMWLPDEFVVSLGNPKKVCPHYCQFSGGGDLLIKRNQVPVPLVFVSRDEDPPYTESPSTTEDASTESQSDGHASACEVSPVKTGTTRLTSFAMEAKKQVGCDNLQYQLWANMIVSTVDEFLRGLKDGRTEITHIFSLQQLEGYGIALAGNGTVGMYKVEMGFNEETRFINKIGLGCFDRRDATILLDKSIEYVIDRLKTM